LYDLLPPRFVFGLKHHQVLRRQDISPSEAAVQAGIQRNEAEEAEVRKVDIELGFRMTIEKKRSDAIVSLALPIDALRAAT